MSNKISSNEIANNAEEVTKAQQKADLIAAKMAANVNDMKQQGEKLSHLHSKTDALVETSGNFRATSRKAKSKAFWNYMKWMILLLLLLILIAVFVGYKLYNKVKTP